MKVTFWGTRGSIPTSGPKYVGYGGNTPCVQVQLESTKDVVVFDSGTGIRELGLRLVQTAREHSRVIHLFLTHAHWDHIQGFPFFIPAFLPDFTIHFYCTKDAKAVLDGQMSAPYFPVTMDIMGSQKHFHLITAQDAVTVGEARVTNIPTPHPQGSTAFRIDEKDKSLVFATDTEHAAGTVNQHLAKFAKNADALIYDAQYTPEEYNAGKQGWGHSTYSEAVKLVQAAGAKKLVLFSHDPGHDDDTLHQIEEAAKGLFPDTLSARDGLDMPL